MQEKTLPKPKTRTSNIHSGEVGCVSYDIFGSPYQKTGSFLADDSLDFGYLGKPYNGDTELYDYGFRDYSPNIARFTSVDPIRDGRNWYSYVVNDPVNFVDLWGLCGSEGVIFKTYIPTKQKEINEKISGSLLPNSNYTEKTQNQNKEQKALWGEVTSVEKKGEVSFEAEAGVYSVSSELNESTPIIGKAQIDVLTSEFNVSVTDGGIGAGFGLDAISVSGEVGVKFSLFGYEIEVSIGGAVGASVGVEGKLDINSGFILDFGAIIKPRIEIKWDKEDEKK